MVIVHPKWSFPSLSSGREPRQAGFSLIEFLVAMAVFLTVSAAAFVLFNTEQQTLMTQQAQSGLNIAMRNATSQIQMDLVNGGTAYFQGTNVPGWPVGVTVVNNVVASGSSCYNATTLAYGANCFDALNIIAGANPATSPPSNTTDSTGANGTGNCSTTSSGNAYGQAASGLTLAQTAALYPSGTQVLFVTTSAQQMTTAVLTAAAQVAGSAVKFTFNATNTDGTNTLANDPLNITACDGNGCSNTTYFTNQFCGEDWVLPLAPITYQVNSSTSSDPQLTRTQNGVTSVVMDQVIGFKLGATIWESSIDPTNSTYYYDPCLYENNAAASPAVVCPNEGVQDEGDEAYNFSLVRSVRVSLIGRTVPNTNPMYHFRNLFDGGAYQVEGLSVVVNPRNISMHD